jgi:NAD-dependent dihydropyrimidine dehydrogenase PreA subunit
MAYVIAEPCIGTKDTACVDACPVDCIHPKKDEADHGAADQLFIDPVECIDCGACVPECPVEAIFDETQVPDNQKHWTAINAERSLALPVINVQGDPLPGAQERKEKLGF